jgi:hypothetical protein
MPEAVERLVESYRIRSCLVDAARGADRVDAELMASSFWPDATVRYGSGARWSVAELLRAWVPVAGVCASTQHHLFNHLLDIDGDSAFAESYYIAVFAPGAAGSLLPFCGSVAAGEVGFQGGRYVDRLARRDGEWRIAAREVCGDWFATAEGSGSGSRALREAAGRPCDGLDELLAVDAIRDCVFRYARGVDRLDMDLLDSVFVDPVGTQEVGDTWPMQSTYVTNLRVTLDGAAAAVAEAYVISVHRGSGTAVHLAGRRCIVELVEASGRWRIARMTTLDEWHAAGDGRYLDAFLQATGNKSRRSREDASYDPEVTDGVSRTVDDLLAREGVRDSLARYARGADRLDREVLESAHVDVAPQFVDYMFRQAEVRPVQNHYWTNLRIELAGDAAFIEAYYISVHGYVDGAGTGFIAGVTSADDINLIGGRYVRWFEKVGERWALRNLSTSTVYPPPSGGLGDWHAMLDGSGLPAYCEATGNGGHPRGSRSDPSYARR